jgi:hypothetical protein
MKISKYFYTLVLAVMAAGALSLASCSKDKDEAPQPEPEPVPVVPEKTLVEKIESVIKCVLGPHSVHVWRRYMSELLVS